MPILALVINYIIFTLHKKQRGMAEKKSLKMLHDRVLVLPDPPEEKSGGGIVIPDQAQERPIRGTVINAGPGKDGITLEVKEGDKIVYGKHAGIPVKIPGDDAEYVMMRESEILAVEVTTQEPEPASEEELKQD
jgi:chaperonin GroES